MGGQDAVVMAAAERPSLSLGAGIIDALSAYRYRKIGRDERFGE